MDNPDDIYGWAVEDILHPSADHPSAKPAVRLTKGEHWVVTVGNKDIDRQTLIERAAVEALQLEAAHAPRTEQIELGSKLRRAKAQARMSMLERIDPRVVE